MVPPADAISIRTFLTASPMEVAVHRRELMMGVKNKVENILEGTFL